MTNANFQHLIQISLFLSFIIFVVECKIQHKIRMNMFRQVLIIDYGHNQSVNLRFFKCTNLVIYQPPLIAYDIFT